MRYKLFAGDRYYPLGGFRDFHGYVSSIEEAREKLDQLDLTMGWAHIVDGDKIKVELWQRDNEHDWGTHWEMEET